MGSRVRWGGSYSKGTALAKQNALARQLKSSLKGEIVPDPEEVGSGEGAAVDGGSDKRLGDEEYRDAAAQYEIEAGREPELGDPHQSGWDVRSTDPKTNEIRLIEVKGKGCPWDDVEVVELSGAQVRKAFEATESWYLYVVEKMDKDTYQVLPISNPVARCRQMDTLWRILADGGRGTQDGCKSCELISQNRRWSGAGGPDGCPGEGRSARCSR